MLLKYHLTFWLHRLEELSITMAALKKQSDESFQVLGKAQSELPSVVELKNLAKETVHRELWFNLHMRIYMTSC